MRPKRIVLIRHGQSLGNVDKSIYNTIPDYALRLTPKGVQEAINAGKELKSIIGDERIRFYVSSFHRTRETYQGIIKSFDSNKFTTRENTCLIEQEWSGAIPVDGYSTAAEMERDNYGHFYYRFNGGESCNDVLLRVSSFLDTMFRDFEKVDFPENVVIVTHGMTLRVFLMRFFHYTVEQFEVLANPKNCEIITLEQNKFDNRYHLKSSLRTHVLKHSYQYPL